MNGYAMIMCFFWQLAHNQVTSAGTCGRSVASTINIDEVHFSEACMKSLNISYGRHIQHCLAHIQQLIRHLHKIMESKFQEILKTPSNSIAENTWVPTKYNKRVLCEKCLNVIRRENETTTKEIRHFSTNCLCYDHILNYTGSCHVKEREALCKDSAVSSCANKPVTNGLNKDLQLFYPSLETRQVNQTYFIPSFYPHEFLSKVNETCSPRGTKIPSEYINYINLKTGENISIDLFNEVTTELILYPEEIKIIIPGKGIYPLFTFPTNSTDFDEILLDAIFVLGAGTIVRPSVLIAILQFVQWIRNLGSSVNSC